VKDRKIKRINEKPNFKYVQYYCVCSKIYHRLAPFSTTQDIRTYEVSFNIAGEYSIKTVNSQCFKSGRGYVIIFIIKNTLMSVTSP